MKEWSRRRGVCDGTTSDGGFACSDGPQGSVGPVPEIGSSHRASGDERLQPHVKREATVQQSVESKGRRMQRYLWGAVRRRRRSCSRNSGAEGYVSMKAAIHRYELAETHRWS